jgi:uncharacterized surface protein with fasciclin (FAS1) repeats/plastocyanin
MKKILHFISALILLTSGTSFAQCAADTIVILNNFEFVPSELVITPGQTVAFINLEGIHNVNGINNSITGEPFNNPTDFFLNDTLGDFEGVCMGVIEFETPGVYNFDSSVGFDANAEMNLQITVDAFDLADLIQTIGLFNSPYAFQYYLPFPYMTDLGPWTLFVPNDQAVTDILTYMSLGQFDALAIPDFPEILEYHIAPGSWMEEDLYDGLALLSAQGQDLNISESNGALFVEDAQIITTNLTAYNGVIHVIDKCLAPDNLPGAHVMQIITESANHEILRNAIIELGLDDELSFQATIDDSYDGPGPWTVFAPTDAAFQVFAEMMGMTINELLDSQFLYSIITQHIINGCVDDFNAFYEIDEYCPEPNPALVSTDINSGTIVTNLDNEPLQFIVTDSTLSVIGQQNTVNVIVTDLLSYNGVVHVIDAVIEPKLPEIEPGTCGLWSIELNTSSSEGWSGSQLGIVINDVQIQTITLLEGNQESIYEFGMNIGDVLDLIYFPGSSVSSSSYKLFDGNNNLVVQTAGNANNYGPSGFEGITACDNPKESCGEIQIQLISEFGYGWYSAEMNVYRNGEFERSIEMPTGYSQYTSITSYYGDSFDFYPNLNPALFYPEEYGYKIYDNNGNTLVDQNSLNESPESVLGISICTSNVSIKEIQNIDSKLVKMFDLLGREQTVHSSGSFLFYLFENGEILKVIK